MLNDLTANFSDILHHPGKIYPTLLAAALGGTAVMVFLHLLLALLGGRAAKPRHRFNIWEKLVYLGALVSVAVLGITSFYTVLRFGGMHGWWLFAHMFGAGALTGVLPLLALTWCAANRFGRMTEQQREEPVWPRFFWIPRVMFWLFLLAGFTVLITMLVSMLPIFGTDGLKILLDIHRYAGLLAVVTLLIHFYCVLLQRLQLR
jgi:cytochrome b subunit of formate dehydrogenase